MLRQLIPALPRDTPVDYFGDPTRGLRVAGIGDGVLRVPRLPGGRGAEVIERAAIGTVLLARERRHQPMHLFLAPGALTERVAAGLVATPEPMARTRSLAHRASRGVRSWLGVASSMLQLRGRPSAHARPAPVLQTLTCGTGIARYAALLESLDGVVVLSEHSRSRLIGAGVSQSKVHRIYPGVRKPARAIADEGALAGRKAVLYAGELDVGATDHLIEVARTLAEPTMRGWTLIIACRPSPEDAPMRVRLRRELAGAIGSGRVEIHGEVDDMDGLLHRCAVQLFVADQVHRRVDLPLVLLEGLAAGLPLVALDRPPVREVFMVAEQRGLAIGARVDGALGPQAVVAAVHRLVDQPRLLLAASRACAELSTAVFSAKRMAQEYTALHQQVLERFG